jgi:predicted small integral membrane protein
MTLRLAKIALVASVAFFYTLVVFNNTTDFGSNYQFVHHVLLMDTTFPGNHGMWRSIPLPVVQLIFYDSIIGWEAVTAILIWMGTVQLLRALRRSAADFNSAKRCSIIGLTLGQLLWLVAFVGVGGEWFLMWQSKTWNGEEAAFRMFTIISMVFVLLALPDTEMQTRHQ